MASEASIEKADRIVQDYQQNSAALRSAIAQALDRAFKTGQQASLWHVENDEGITRADGNGSENIPPGFAPALTLPTGQQHDTWWPVAAPERTDA
jgi:hypothetical protein